MSQDTNSSKSPTDGAQDHRAQIGHRARIVVPFHEAGPDGTIRLGALADHLQQAAGDHAAALGLGAARLADAGLHWVLTRQYVRIARAPRGGEAITIETWPSERPRQLFQRDFRVTDAAGAALAVATSSWALIDAASRRAVKGPPGVVTAIEVTRRRAAEYPARTIPRLQDHTFETPIRARWSDLDANRHVNNAVLASWVIEALPFDILGAHRLRAIDIAFRNECGPGDEVLSRAQPTGALAYRHALVRAADGTELARAESEWEPA
jgi:medium-chain acyl-[acyl-carrier-protein] hydrolase